MKAEELLEKYRDMKVAEVVRYDPDTYCDIASMPRWDVPRKVILATAVTGSFVDKRQNPNQPFTPEECVAQSHEVVAEGASWLHFHTRDEEGRNVGGIDTYKRIVEPLRAAYGSSVVIDGCPLFGNNFDDAVVPVTRGLFEVGIVNPVCTFVGPNVRWTNPNAIQASAEYFRALGVKINVSIHDTASIDNLERLLIRPGLLEKPYFFSLLANLPGFGYTPHPKGLQEWLMLIVNRLKELDEDCQISVNVCGRASVYMLALALVMGLHVRVGMEDTIWLYPDRDDKLESNVQAFRVAKAFCELLGREIATAEETRTILGMPSPKAVDAG